MCASPRGLIESPRLKLFEFRIPGARPISGTGFPVYCVRIDSLEARGSFSLYSADFTLCPRSLAPLLSLLRYLFGHWRKHRITLSPERDPSDRVRVSTGASTAANFHKFHMVLEPRNETRYGKSS